MGLRDRILPLVALFLFAMGFSPAAFGDGPPKTETSYGYFVDGKARVVARLGFDDPLTTSVYRLEIYFCDDEEISGSTTLRSYSIDLPYREMYFARAPGGSDLRLTFDKNWTGFEAMFFQDHKVIPMKPNPAVAEKLCHAPAQ